jgi:hypothetical protein
MAATCRQAPGWQRADDDALAASGVGATIDALVARLLGP